MKKKNPDCSKPKRKNRCNEFLATARSEQKSCLGFLLLGGSDRPALDRMPRLLLLLALTKQEHIWRCRFWLLQFHEPGRQSLHQLLVFDEGHSDMHQLVPVLVILSCPTDSSF